MDASDAIQVLILIFLIACSAFFSSSETAMTTVSKIRVRNLAEGGDRRAILLSRLIEEPGKMLSAILIGNNIVNISASSLATILATKWLGSAGAGYIYRCPDPDHSGIWRGNSQNLCHH